MEVLTMLKIDKNDEVLSVDASEASVFASILQILNVFVYLSIINSKFEALLV